MSTQVLLYHKKTGEVVSTYPASVKEWMATGEYQTEPPKNAKSIRPPQKLPSAGREANRLNPVVDRGPTISAASEVDATQPDEQPSAAAEVEPEAEKPKRAEPRRRPRASSGD
jgi:hypothetical protein|tara:strand:+ start:5826 stop:6164 length:339 start_codon:yes stop_codon:yes gene_type:complete